MEKAKINRTQLIDLSNAAFQLGNFDCARKLLIAWLKEFPNEIYGSDTAWQLFFINPGKQMKLSG